jgi:hypothetical protein
VEKELHKNQLAQIEFELPLEQEKLLKFRMAAKQRGLIEKKRGRAQSQLQFANLDLAQDEEHKVLYIKQWERFINEMQRNYNFCQEKLVRKEMQWKDLERRFVREVESI